MTNDENFEILLLIGPDYYWNIVQDNIRGDGPTGMQSKLGYLLSGPLPCSTGKENTTKMFNIMISHKAEDKQLERFWKLESIGITPPHPDDTESSLLKECQHSSVSREKDGTYTAKFLWKNEHTPLPSN